MHPKLNASGRTGILLSAVLFCAGGLAQTSSLVGSGVGGNPGWQYAVEQGDGVRSMCQATLIQAEGGICAAATASHCIESIYQVGVAAGTVTAHESTGSYTGVLKMESHDFGKVGARYYFNPMYLPHPYRLQDTAVLSWYCRDESVQVPVIPVAAVGMLKPNERLVYGKVMSGKAGLYPAYVYREPYVTGIQGAPIGTHQESVVQPEATLIEQGDSGGGLYRRFGDGKLELVGVLSTSDDVTRRWPIGNYATNLSLGFLHRVSKVLKKR